MTKLPLAFIGLAVLFLPLLFYKNFVPFRMPKLLFAAILFLLLCGYFIAPIDIDGRFNLNVMFAFGALIFVLQLWFTIPNKTKLWSLLVMLLGVGTYMGITFLNTDTISFLSYTPALLIATVCGLVFLPNPNASCGSAMGTLILIEWSNYFSYVNHMGYLSICSSEFMQAAFLVCAMLCLVCWSVVTVKKQITVKRRAT